MAKRCKLGIHKLDFGEIGAKLDEAKQITQVDYFCSICQHKIKSVSSRKVMFSKNDEQVFAYKAFCDDWLQSLSGNELENDNE